MVNIVNFIFALVGIIIVVGISIKIIKNIFSKEKTVKATVVDKQCYDKQIYIEKIRLHLQGKNIS